MKVIITLEAAWTNCNRWFWKHLRIRCEAKAISTCDNVTSCIRTASSSPTQLAGVPDQVPSAWHSLMLVPWRSKSGRHRNPQAASKWLLHTFWTKKPFSGGDSTGQYTTGKRQENKKRYESPTLIWRHSETSRLATSLWMNTIVFSSATVRKSLDHSSRNGRGGGTANTG